MEEKKKKRPGAASIIFWIIGFCLIVTGLVLPQLMFKKTHTFSVDSDLWGKNYEFEIEINEPIKEETAIAKIKIDGATTKSFNIKYNVEESSYGDYVFNLTLDDEDANMFNEVVEVKVKTESNKEIVFENEDNFDNFGANSKKILLTVFPMFFGVFFVILGSMLIVAKKSIKHIKKVNDKIMDSLFGEDEEDKPVESKNTSSNTITCSYCKLENDSANAKCEHCGAPLIRKKK